MENFWYDKVCPEKDAGVEKEKGKKMRYGKIRIEDGFADLPTHCGYCNENLVWDSVDLVCDNVDCKQKENEDY